MLVVLGGFAHASTVAQHVHGVVELGIVVDGSTVAVSLNAPMPDVVGFEHAPESDEQIKSIRQAAAMLSSAPAMFGLADAGNWTVANASVEGPAFATECTETEASNEAAHDDDHHDDHDDGEEEHREINANYEWTCGDVAELDAIALPFTGSFASAETIEVQILTPAGAQALTLEGRAASVVLSRR